MSDILLNDILQIEDEKLNKVKIRFNLSNKSWDAINLFKENRRKLLIGNYHNVLETENKRGIEYLKEGEIVICLAQINGDEWLLFDIAIITKNHHRTTYDGKSDKLNYFYDHESLLKYEKYFGRLIVEYHKKTQYPILKGKERLNEFKVKSILPNSYNDDYFPGYENVNIQWKGLQQKIQNNQSWRTALENQKGIYLLTDHKNGKMYVGSAFGEKMILGRWESYINTRDGGNKELKKLEREYIENNFWFSILEIFKSTTDKDTIIDREQWWKKVLQTKDFGYNAN